MRCVAIGTQIPGRLTPCTLYPISAASSTKASQRGQTDAPPRPMSKTPHPPGHSVTSSAGLGGKPPAAVRCQAPASGVPVRII